MKIKQSKLESIEFPDLPIGAVFKMGDDVFLKLSPQKQFPARPNAVNLSKDTLTLFEEDDDMSPIYEFPNAELNLNPEN